LGMSAAFRGTACARQAFHSRPDADLSEFGLGLLHPMAWPAARQIQMPTGRGHGTPRFTPTGGGLLPELHKGHAHMVFACKGVARGTQKHRKSKCPQGGGTARPGSHSLARDCCQRLSRAMHICLCLPRRGPRHAKIKNPNAHRAGARHAQVHTHCNANLSKPTVSGGSQTPGAEAGCGACPQGGARHAQNSKPTAQGWLRSSRGGSMARPMRSMPTGRGTARPDY
jgi:hypothetical protein